mmetsp:Transcript_105551/g.305322  ORF Transcript_105551/g.305322 Transcript_105551/m.305322 type:complete len:227 (-) Transcript_105551:51-731(-)|eukprot:CAMPEP_0176001958 /NCGR_PEP_ID=MMETSP0120_2-20121206/398_1 /TAXON_ID=160619 /ORGANISM="Kryptoperidinium foliaceum, Strain CCMP 1326" /LENGTH=226 /DNA_ID=CAMNT_0017334529 /DNA_START=111 /DNA_END=791 /DNA_ORIENTATION=+
MGKATSLRPTPRDNAIRSKLLNRLGIYKPATVRTGERRKHVLRSLSMISQPAEPFKLPLNDTSGDCSDPPRQESGQLLAFPPSPPSMVSPTSSTSPTSLDDSFNSNDRTIQFDSEVLVVPIPSRHEYSNRIKKFLWSDAEELSHQVERNRLEFEAEGWSLEGVVEDDEMYIDSNSGELVHPIWLEGDLYDEEDEMMLDASEDEPLPRLTRAPSFAANLQELGEETC